MCSLTSTVVISIVPTLWPAKADVHLLLQTACMLSDASGQFSDCVDVDNVRSISNSLAIVENTLGA